MIRVFCDICRKELPLNTPAPHLCERCAPFAADFYDQMAANLVKSTESFRQRFLQQNVIKKLEAVK